MQVKCNCLLCANQVWMFVQIKNLNVFDKSERCHLKFDSGLVRPSFITLNHDEAVPYVRLKIDHRYDYFENL